MATVQISQFISHNFDTVGASSSYQWTLYVEKYHEIVQLLMYNSR